jgi:hypothetical protein
MVVHSNIYTIEELQNKFLQCMSDAEFIRNIEDIDEVEKFGVIIMESFGDVKRLQQTDVELPIALREMYMLAQVGYKDDSRSLDNFLISRSKHVYMIDFGSAEPIDPIDPAQSEIEVLSQIYKSDLLEEDEQDEDLKIQKIINLTQELAPTEEVWGALQMTPEMEADSLKLMTGLSLVDLTELGPHTKRSKMGGKKSRRKRIKKTMPHLYLTV